MSKYFHQNSITEIGNKYDLVVIAARRARDLKNSKKSRNPITDALGDIEQQIINKDYALDKLLEDAEQYRESQEETQDDS